MSTHHSPPLVAAQGATAILRTGFQIIPLTPSRVALRHRTTGQTILVEHPSLPVLSICESLKMGADVDALIGSTAGGDSCRAAAVRSIVARLEEVSALRRVQRPEDVDPLVERRFARLLSHFSERETDETSRHDYLRRLREARVLLLGVGGLGSWTLLHLVASGVGHVTAVDMDRVEASNLARQALFLESDVGRPKVAAAQDAVARLSTLTTFVAVEKVIASAADITDLVRQSAPIDLVILTADTPLWQISCWASEAAMTTGVPLLRGNSLGVGPLMKPGLTACPACAWPSLVDRIPAAEALVRYYRASRATLAGVGATSTTLAIAGSILAEEALSFLTGGDVRTFGRQVRWRDGQIESVDFPRDSRCPSCSPP